MDLLKLATTINEAPEPTNPKEVVDALSHALVGKKITAFGPGGKGLWGDHPEVQTYRIKRIVPHLYKEDGEYQDWGNIDIYLDGYHHAGIKGKDAKGNVTILGGLIYTDKTFEKHLKDLLRTVPAMKFVKSLGYSEQGMQGNTYVNLDIDFKKFPKMVKEANKKSTEKKDPSSVVLDVAHQGDEKDPDADTIKWAKKYNCTAKKLRANGPGGGWPEWKFTGKPEDIRKLVTNYDAGNGEVEHLLGHVNEAIEPREYEKLENKVRGFVGYYNKSDGGDWTDAELKANIKAWLTKKGIDKKLHNEAHDIIYGMLGDANDWG